MEQEVFSVVGYQYGQFEEKDGPNKGNMKSYVNLFVLQDMSGEQSDKYHFCGAKALKVPCTDPGVLSDVKLGSHVNLYFDSKKRVTFVRAIPAAK